VAPRTAVTVLVSPPNRVDLHQWDSAGHPAPKITTSAGYVCKKSIDRALNDRVARAVAACGRAEVLASTDMCYCNSKYSGLYEHYVDSIQ